MSTSDRRPARSGPPASSTRQGGGAGNEPGHAGGTSRSTRQGRRTRTYGTASRPSFFERYRSLLVAAVVIGAVGLVGAFVFLGATSPSYACSIEWEPEPTPSPSPDASGRLGYVQPDMGRLHDVRNPQRYTYCPPASGTHYNVRGQGPIQPGLYGPTDDARPQGWIHNLEHGGLVVLYRCREGDEGCSEAAQQQLRQLYGNFPNSPICNLQRGVTGPVIARFDEMAYPYAALVWNRVLPLETLDTEKILEFYRTEGERTNPERACAPPSPSPGPTESPAGSPGASPGTSPASTPAESPGETDEPSPTAS